jgi:hypothetical protein
VLSVAEQGFDFAGDVEDFPLLARLEGQAVHGV